jgi:thiol-disulfide isomerase/thioredoxin
MRRILFLFSVFAFSVSAFSQCISGVWNATVTVGDVDVPFRFEVTGSGDQVQGWFFNGDEHVVSTSGSLHDDHLTLNFDQFATRLELDIKGPELSGSYVRPKGPWPVQAVRAASQQVSHAAAPNIGGLWEVEVKSPKGETAWRFIVRQSGADVSAAILRVDGDTGTLTGTYKDGEFVLSHFSGARPLLLAVKPNSDGTLTLTLNKKQVLPALRPEEARARGYPEPADPQHNTSLKDANEPLQFNGVDFEGHVISNSDPRFRGKVVIVAIGGSWCPNCHDEAPFLETLYRKYHSQGLEIVDLSFEEGDQLKNPTRLRAFVKRYGIDYIMLLAGEPTELHEKLPQVVNLNSWPTTFFLGRDGRVREVHAGFAAAATGDLHRKLIDETNALVQQLLTEKARSGE